MVRDDSGVASFPDRVKITVNDVATPPSNKSPVAVNDLIPTSEPGPITLDVLFNDSDPDGDTISILSLDPTGTVGTISHDTAVVTFDAVDGQSYSTSFQYTITDDFLTSTATVTIDVTDNSITDDALLHALNPEGILSSNMGTRVAQIDDQNADGADDILVSAPGALTSSFLGQVYVIDGDTTENSSGGSLINTIPSPNGNAKDGFGYSIDSIGSNTIIVGAPRYDKTSTELDYGAVYLFTLTSLSATIFPDTLLSAHDHFGSSITIYDDKNCNWCAWIFCNRDNSFPHLDYS